jgi:hypothetical protein
MVLLTWLGVLRDSLQVKLALLTLLFPGVPLPLIQRLQTGGLHTVSLPTVFKKIVYKNPDFLEIIG